MKTIALILTAAAALAAQDQARKTPQPTPLYRSRPSRKASAQPPKPAASPNASVQGPSIPPGATQVGPNLYRYTDAQGKTWMYGQTPFGFSKWEDVPAPQPVVEQTNPVTITDLGDSVQFERRTPFGASKWTHKKTELTADEKAWLDREQARQKSAPAAAALAPAGAANPPAEKQ